MLYRRECEQKKFSSWERYWGLNHEWNIVPHFKFGRFSLSSTINRNWNYGHWLWQFEINFWTPKYRFFRAAFYRGKISFGKLYPQQACDDMNADCDSLSSQPLFVSESVRKEIRDDVRLRSKLVNFSMTNAKSP